MNEVFLLSFYKCKMTLCTDISVSICKILMSEARIWSVVRSASQIQNNMTQVSPKSVGLEAYWRFNEGQGNVFEDATGKGHTLTTSATPTWIDGILSTDKSTEWK